MKMKTQKVLSAVIAFMLTFALLCPSAFAAEPRWSNVASISPTIYASEARYTSEVIGLSGTTKIDCTLVLYEKSWTGAYSEVSRTNQIYYGQVHQFIGYYNIKSGTTYKLVTTASVTCNGSTETVSTTFEKKC